MEVAEGVAEHLQEHVADNSRYLLRAVLLVLMVVDVVSHACLNPLQVHVLKTRCGGSAAKLQRKGCAQNDGHAPLFSSCPP